MKNLTPKFEHDKYLNVFKEQKADNIIKKAPSDHNLGKTDYLPHKPVIRHDKATTKLRIVFDASMKVDALSSLNECLHAGPSLTSSLFGLLLRFSKHVRELESTHFCNNWP